MKGRDPLITLTTDFGWRDPFVGQVKGIIYGINPNVEIVDITHEITPHDIQEGAIVTGLSYKYFPLRTIHLVIVDPGVGSIRKPIIVTTERHYFVGPDNGIFSFIYALEKDSFHVTHITADHYFLNKDSPTFQGRDVFAPVTGWLSKGIPVKHFGELTDDYVRRTIPEPEVSSESRIEGEIIYIDRFGNALSNISRDIFYSSFEGTSKILINGKVVHLKRHYAEAGDRDLYCLFNSFRLLEFFTNRGRATESHNIKVGDTVSVERG
jgi:S-adenosylmethionine hydrolase